MKRNLCSSLLVTGMILSLAGMVTACKDDEGPTISSVCKKFCNAADECWDYDLSDDEMDDCIHECKDDFDDTYHGDMAECEDAAIAYGNCYYSALLSEDCDEEDADDNCDDEGDEIDDCWEDNYDYEYSSY